MALTLLNTLSIPQDTIVAADIADNSVDIARLNVTDGTAGQFLKTDGSNVLGFASVTHPYTSWSVVNSAQSPLAVSGQYISNGSTALTHTLPLGAAGDTVIMHNSGTATVILARTSSQLINSTNDDGELLANATTQLVYVSTAIGWKEI